MTKNGNILDNIKPGLHVEINPQTDQTRKLIVKGKVSEVLTNSSTHPHGILVLLESGEKGRVKAILNTKVPTNVNNDHVSPTSDKSLKKLIKIGENFSIEFKSAAEWSKKLQQEEIIKSKSPEVKKYGQKASKIILAKTIAGFLNTEGGTLIIGVQEEKKADKDIIIGIEGDYKFLKDKNEDGYGRMIEDLVMTYFPDSIFNHYNKYFNILFERIENKVVCGIKVSKSTVGVFVNFNNKDHFYIRGGASTRELTGQAMLNYCNSHFS